MKSSVRDAAKGRWAAILPALGVDKRFLGGRHGPCPMCEGRDRFRWDDREGTGSFLCSKCGAGDGVKLVMLVGGLSFKDAAREIEKLVGTAPVTPTKPKPDVAEVRRRMNELWASAVPLVRVEAAVKWWMHRTGRMPCSPDLRAVEALPYRDASTDDAQTYPAMLALVRGWDGKPGSIHRTYLSADGSKAPVRQVRKQTSGLTVPPGSAVRLSPVGPVLGIAEGLETTEAASILFGVPVWSALDASHLQSWKVPDQVEEVHIFADNDSAKEFTGQLAAYNLAKRLKSEGKRVLVHVPASAGDFNDVLAAKRKPC